MVNQVILVGKIYSEIITQEIGNSKRYKVTISVPRTYKNEEGEYENDIIETILPGMFDQYIADKIIDIGDVIGIKGRMQTTNNKQEIIAEKITILSSKSKE